MYYFYAGKIKPKEPGNHAMMVGKFGSLRVKRPDYKVAYVTMVSPTTVLVGRMHVVSNSRLTVPYSSLLLFTYKLILMYIMCLPSFSFFTALC